MSIDTAIYLLAGVILTFFVGMILFVFFYHRLRDWYDRWDFTYSPPHLDDQGLPEPDEKTKTP